MVCLSFLYTTCLLESMKALGKCLDDTGNRENEWVTADLRAGLYLSILDWCFRFHTGFHQQLAEGSLTSPEDPGSAASLEARIGTRLPERELRVLYRISTLTGVVLEEDVMAVGADTSSLTVVPNCEQTELHYARRCLHR